jgi:hypothetical protein
MRHSFVFTLVWACVHTSLVFGQARESLPATLFGWDGTPAPLGELPPIATDRPDFTEASSTVGKGVAQIEMGYTFTKTVDGDIHSWGEPLLRFGMFANWLEFRVAASPITENFGTLQSGSDDLYLGTKLGLTQQDGWLPEVAIVPQMTVPSGSLAFTADEVLPGVNLLYGWDVTDDFTFAGSTQYNRAGDGAGSSYDEWAQSLTLGRSLTERLGSYLEAFAILPANNSGVSSEHYFNGGFTLGLSDDAQFDLRAGKGLGDASEDYFVGAGLSLRFH